MTAEEEARELFRLEADISSGIDEWLADGIGYRGLRHDGQKYEFEETEDPDDPWVLVRESDGQRFEVDVDVFVRRLPPKPAPIDDDAPVHCEGQEEIPLGVSP